MLLWFYGILLLPAWAAAVSVNVDLEETFYLGKHYFPNGTTKSYDYNAKLALMVAADEPRKILYAVGHKYINILDYNEPQNPNGGLLKPLLQKQLGSYILKKVGVCGDHVFITTKNGDLLVYEAYDASTSTDFTLVNTVTLGPIPTHFKIVNDCTKVIIAQQSLDQHGKIVIVKFQADLAEIPEIKELQFDSYLDKTVMKELVGGGFVKNGARFTQPKWVSVNSDETKAYISFRMNNAIAAVDLTTDTILSLNPLEPKDWSSPGGTQGFDGNSDGSIDLKTSPIKAVYNPDAIECLTLDGQEYLFTANAAASKIEGLTTLEDLEVESNLVNRKARIVENCPGLTVLSVDNIDKDENGKADDILTIGGRSISMFNSDTFELVADTGSGIEKGIKSVLPKGFNSDPAKDETILESLDSTSSLEGPGVETLAAVPICDGSAILVVAGARFPGTLHVYTVEAGNNNFEQQAVLHGYEDKSGKRTDLKLYEKFKLKMRNISTLQILGGSSDSLTLVVGSRRIETINRYSLGVTCA